MGHAFNSILDGMREIVHRVNAPFVTGILVRHMCHTIDDGISHVDVGRGHIDAGTQYLSAVLVFAGLHILEQCQILFYASGAAGIFLTGLGQASSVFTDLLRT